MRFSKQVMFVSVVAIIFICLLIVVSLQIKKSEEIDENAIVKPKVVNFDHSLNKDKLNQLIRTAELYYTFCDTGEYKYLNAAIAPNFTMLSDNKQHNIQAIKLKNYNLRKAIPDLRCAIDDLIVTENKITARLTLSGTSKGNYLEYAPSNKRVKYAAIDVLQLQNGKIIEVWHLEDKLALLKQLNVIQVTNNEL